MNGDTALADRARALLGAGAALPAPVPSPCVSVCRMQASSGLCEGCWRTLDEIAGWSRAGDAERLATWRRIAARLDARAEAPTQAPTQDPIDPRTRA